MSKSPSYDSNTPSLSDFIPSITPQSNTHPFQTHPSLCIPCTFAPSSFLKAMDNLMRNPNITSSHLFRADMIWDSETDWRCVAGDENGMSADLKEGLRPLRCDVLNTIEKEDTGSRDVASPDKPRHLEQWEQWQVMKTCVRELVARNPKLDRNLVQTVRILQRKRRTFDGYSKLDGQNRHRETGSEAADLGANGDRLPPNDKQEDFETTKSQSSETTNGDSKTIKNASQDVEAADTLIVYLPHVQTEEFMPYYHPPVRALAFLYRYRPATDPLYNGTHYINNDSTTNANTTTQHTSSSNFSIHISPFPTPHTAHNSSPQPQNQTHDKPKNPTRLPRTLQNLLLTISKHAHHPTYVKHTHHDLIIPQHISQNTYTRLKLKHARYFLENWLEQTDPRKDVFEDLGIAAFLVEYWRGIGWGVGGGGECEGELGKGGGFVDLACGNGLLTHILLSEGFEGVGIDARARKTWSLFPESTRSRLEEAVLNPLALLTTTPSKPQPQTQTQTNVSDPKPRITLGTKEVRINTCAFARDTFIIANHSDELSIWTPVLTYLTAGEQGGFASIPCCSFDFAGRRFRAPVNGLKKGSRALFGDGGGTVLVGDDDDNDNHDDHAGSKVNGVAAEKYKEEGNGRDLASRQAAETGSLRTAKNGRGNEIKGPGTGKAGKSAYQALTDYIASLSSALGQAPRKEMLRIPSTRNACVVGSAVPVEKRGTSDQEWNELLAARKEMVRKVIEAESGLPLEQIESMWLERAEKVVKGKGGKGEK